MDTPKPYSKSKYKKHIVGEYSRRKTHSIIRELREQKKSTEEFEIMISRLTLEELIAIKLELSAKIFSKNKFYGFPLWLSFPKIVKEALLRFAYYSTTSNREAARFLGLSETHLHEYSREYGVSTSKNKPIETLELPQETP